MDLIVAAANGNIQRVQELLEYGADINIKNYDGDTVLIEASYRGYTEIVRLLLEKGADPNIKNRFEQTALMMASTRGYTKIVRLLLENGADPNIRNNVSGMTALDQALIYEHTDIVELLKRYMDLQRMQRSLQNLAFMKYFLDRDNLDIDTASKIFSNERSYNPSVHTRMIDEHKKDPLTKSKQRLATMKGIHDRNSVLQYLREPELMENVNEYLSSMRPQPSVQNRMMLEDKQRGRGKRSKKHSSKKKSNQKKKPKSKQKSKTKKKK